MNIKTQIDNLEQRVLSEIQHNQNLKKDIEQFSIEHFSNSKNIDDFPRYEAIKRLRQELIENMVKFSEKVPEPSGFSNYHLIDVCPPNDLQYAIIFALFALENLSKKDSSEKRLMIVYYEGE